MKLIITVSVKMKLVLVSTASEPEKNHLMKSEKSFTSDNVKVGIRPTHTNMPA